MKRQISLTLAAAALFGLSACGGGASSAGGKYIPEAATIMGGIDWAGMMKSQLFTDAKASLEKMPQYKMGAELAKGCNLNVDTMITAITFGADDKGGVAAVVTGEGIGDEKNLTCLADASKKGGGDAPFTIADEGGKKVLKMGDGKGMGFIIDGRTVVYATKPWEAAVKDLIDGKGKSASDGPNKALFDRADHSKHIWGAGIIPAAMAGETKEIGELKDVSGSIDFANGIAVQGTATLASADQAMALKKQADENLPFAKAGAALVGLDKAADTISVTTKDAQVSVSAAVTYAEIQTAKEKIKSYADKFPFLRPVLAAMGGAPAEAPAMPAPPAANPPPADPGATPPAPAPAN